MCDRRGDRRLVNRDGSRCPRPAIAASVLRRACGALRAVGAPPCSSNIARLVTAPRSKRAAYGSIRAAALLKGGDSGAVVNLDHPTNSRLLKAIGYADADLQMPPDPPGKLPEPAIAALRTWILDGTFWPANAEPAADAKPADAWKSHWSFAPVHQPPVPAVRRSDWPQTPVDHFVLARLEAESISPSPPADRRTLIRRATFDLIGLPPEEDDVARFVADPAPDAFAKVIDRLLDSPHYGERGGAVGSTSRTTPTPKATFGWPKSVVFHSPSPIAITWFARSTRICRSTASSSSSWPPINCPLATTRGRSPRSGF